ncbi:beta-ketoacyl synthase N-terminal-like domain-containing protein [Neisseria wadsworthii]|uniref:Beta-ketoacyl synthase n=1 Tax=Neisseria wadsworthii 9715 TaxID=1030841 RepID=G4CS40_9NEIS|nr:beta-ketoacyl synthase N-terminal-like domain-containing protein [Neisseria wadsworthii]EGZ44954.1 beta-ketoacyl synthase [Neisseria wadsworthii 9715]
MSYLAGISMQCAQGSGSGARIALADSQPPAKIAFDFLNQPQQAAYFRAFDNERLDETALFSLLEQYLLEAAEDAGWGGEALSDTPVFIGSTSYLLPYYEIHYLAQQQPFGKYSLHQFSDHLKQSYGNHQVYCFATACTSSGHALMQAHAMLESGLIERALVVGFETFNLLTLMHFHSLGLLAEQCVPFGGDGFVLGEGIACLALLKEKPDCEKQFRLVSASANTGAASPVETDSESLSKVMRHALQQAGVAADDVCMVKAHAVGTGATDEAEADALQSVFGRQVPLAAFKPLIGHTQGASAALETVLLYQALLQGSLEGGVALQGSCPLGAGFYMANFFGFGSSNMAFVWEWLK